ncbi:MAG: hypothetical protein RIQ28_630 [Pseudomonadota bacterium]|jgi:putative copper resistance protein D
MEEILGHLLRFVHYAGLLMLFGAAAFFAFARDWVAHVPIRPLIGAAILMPLISSGLMALLIAQMMGVSATALDAQMIGAILFGTDMGTAFLVRVGALILGCIVIAMIGRAKLSFPLAMMFYAIALATLPWSGHAATTEGMLGVFHRANDAVHLLTAGAWIGAIGLFCYLVPRAQHDPKTVSPATLLASLHSFTPFGVALAGTVAVTGVVNMELIFGLGNAIAVAQDGYGQLLMLKIALVGLMLGCAIFNARRVRRRVQLRSNDAELLSALRVSLAAELSFAAMVVASVAILSMLMPIE